MALVYTFFKSYISNICNGFTLYIYIYIYINDLEFNWFLTLLFLHPSLATKIKKFKWTCGEKLDSN